MILVYGEMVDFLKSDKILEISEKVNKPNTDNGFNISFFIGKRTSSDEVRFPIYICIYIYIYIS